MQVMGGSEKTDEGREGGRDWNQEREKGRRD